MMKFKQPVVALFDFDGVVMDTETQYTIFWDEIGRRCLPNEPDFGRVIKGQTLAQIYEKHFKGMNLLQEEITDDLNRFEQEMTFEYIPGVVDFMKELRSHAVKMAIVTSSNEKKMSNVYAANPELKQLVDGILTAEMFNRSKPAPDCFLLGAELFGVSPQNCVVFEDSFHGIEAGNTAGMHVVGVATTNSAETIRPLCEQVIPDFVNYSLEKMKVLFA